MDGPLSAYPVPPDCLAVAVATANVFASAQFETRLGPTKTVTSLGGPPPSTIPGPSTITWGTGSVEYGIPAAANSALTWSTTSWVFPKILMPQCIAREYIRASGSISQIFRFSCSWASLNASDIWLARKSVSGSTAKYAIVTDPGAFVFNEDVNIALLLGDMVRQRAAFSTRAACAFASAARCSANFAPASAPAMRSPASNLYCSNSCLAASASRLAIL
jgi:hypothetical protein